MQGVILIALIFIYVALKWRVIIEKLIPWEKGDKSSLKNLIAPLFAPIVLGLGSLGAAYYVIQHQRTFITPSAPTKLAYACIVLTVAEIVQVVAETPVQAKQPRTPTDCMAAYHVVNMALAASQIDKIEQTWPWVAWLCVHIAVYARTISRL